MASFGQLLKQYRQAIIFPQTKRVLSQENLAKLVSDKIGWGISGSAVGYWERDQAEIHKDNRVTLMGLIAVFVEYGSIKTRTEANQFLQSGGYSPLDESELERVNPAWVPMGSRLKTHSKERQARSQVPEPIVVGRRKEVQDYADYLKGQDEHWLLNYYGPGGIGKTALAGKLRQHAHKRSLDFAFVDGTSATTPDQFLNEIATGFAKNESLSEAFSPFDQQYQDYSSIQSLIAHIGGIHQMYDVVGNPTEALHQSREFNLIASKASLAQTLSNRFALERYQRGVEKSLTTDLGDGLVSALEIKHPLAIIIDTYENIEGLDDWVLQELLPTIPKGVLVTILGRNELTKVSYEWKELGTGLVTKEVKELEKPDALSYLENYGLTNKQAQEQIYQFTGGYPLLLVLVRHLASELGGWENIDNLEHSSDRDSIARELLNRILREERVAEIRAFLEKGVVARWFDPGTVSALLDVSPEEGRKIYDKLHRHSFVERHPNGLKFHDKIREILLERLEFTSKAEYNRLTTKLLDYYAQQGGIEAYAGKNSEDGP